MRKKYYNFMFVSDRSRGVIMGCEFRDCNLLIFSELVPVQVLKKNTFRFVCLKLKCYVSSSRK